MRGRNILVHETMLQTLKHLGIHVLTWRIRIVSLASYHHGTCKCDPIFVLSLPDAELPLLALTFDNQEWHDRK